MNRRTFTHNLLTTITSFGLLDSLISLGAISNELSPLTNHWALRLNEYCQDLRKNTLTPAEWQMHIEALYQQVELTDILRFIDFEKLIQGFTYPDLGVNTKRVQFPRLAGLPEKTVFVKKIFGMKKGRAIIPHGHSNMASAHLILKGDMHLRHYKKIRQEDNALIIHPTIDKTIGVGESSSISDEQDNVHWFVANTETAFTFDVIMLDLHGETYDIHNIDIWEQQRLSDGTLRVPMLEVETALKKYGKLSHH